MELLLIDLDRVVGLTILLALLRYVMERHTESQEDTSNLLESGEKHNDEIPSEGGCRDRSNSQHQNHPVLGCV